MESLTPGWRYQPFSIFQPQITPDRTDHNVNFGRQCRVERGRKPYVNHDRPSRREECPEKARPSHPPFDGSRLLFPMYLIEPYFSSSPMLMIIDLDKQSINYASVFGLSEDLDLSGSQFSWAISLFYFGQLVSEYPAAYLMSRLRLKIFVGICMWVIAFRLLH